MVKRALGGGGGRKGVSWVVFFGQYNGRTGGASNQQRQTEKRTKQALFHDFMSKTSLFCREKQKYLFISPKSVDTGAWVVYNFASGDKW